jgi:hypothetical protein
MQIDWLDILGKVFELVLFPAISAAALYFIAWLNAKKQELLKKTKDETTKKYIELLDNVITECVLATNQTYVNTLKKEGAFDASAQKTAFQRTYEAVLAVLTDEAQKYISEVVKDPGAYITNKIEAQVGKTK